MNPKRFFLSFLMLVAVALGTRAEMLHGKHHPKDANDAFAIYSAAIASQDLQKVLDDLTDDVVFLMPNAEPLVGKGAVKAWLESNLKTPNRVYPGYGRDLVVSGELAYGRYDWAISEMPRNGPPPIVHASGWGLVIFRRDHDKIWRVAYEAWGPDRPAK